VTLVNEDMKEIVKMVEVITIGDAMITLDPTSNGPLRFVHSFERKVGGAELNFAIGCARLGMKTGWISRLGNDEFGKHILNFARGEGIDTEHVELVDGYSTSLNFKEVREDGNGKTFYYRDNSPTEVLTVDSIEEEYFKTAKLLHITGVFAALDKEKNLAILQKAIEYAKKHHVLVSMDPNIRLKLWTREEVKEALVTLLPSVDILLTGLDEAEILFDTVEPEKIIEICRGYGVSTVAIKLGESGSIGYKNGEYIEAAPVKASKVVDTVGAGDGFDVGFVYGILNGWTLERTLLFANTIGSMVVSVAGDNEGLPLLEEVLIRLGEGEFIER
jgi:2-dehydro-3-deoxygluconokinase